ncbi:hypothetical protein [[Pseudomonas] boreopolis]
MRVELRWQALEERVLRHDGCIWMNIGNGMEPATPRVFPRIAE